jgi:hypothetical protein
VITRGYDVGQPASTPEDVYKPLAIKEVCDLIWSRCSPEWAAFNAERLRRLSQVTTYPVPLTLGVLI